MSTKQVLIIDDDARNIFALKAVLKSKGYQCLSALSAQDGIDLLEKQNDIGIVLMDMMMPDMDGYEALSQIKNNLNIANVPVLAVTAQAMAGDREKCLAAGADGYVSKPIDVRVLQEYLDEFL